MCKGLSCLFLLLIKLYFQYFEHIEETEWAIEVCKESGKPWSNSKSKRQTFSLIVMCFGDYK